MFNSGCWSALGGLATGGQSKSQDKRQQQGRDAIYFFHLISSFNQVINHLSIGENVVKVPKANCPYHLLRTRILEETVKTGNPMRDHGAAGQESALKEFLCGVFSCHASGVQSEPKTMAAHLDIVNVCIGTAEVHTGNIEIG